MKTRNVFRLIQFRGIGSFIAAVFVLCMASCAVRAEKTYELDRILGTRTLFFSEFEYGFDATDTAEWFRQSSGLRGTAGSIANNRFYYDLDAKMSTRPVKELYVAYRFRKEESFTRFRQTHRLSAAYAGTHWIAGLTGMTESEKKFSEIGILAGYMRDDSQWITCRLLWADFIFNEKDEGTGEYVRQPFNVELEGIWKTERITVTGIVNLGTEWQFETEETQRQYRESYGNLAIRYRTGDNGAIILRIAHDSITDSTTETITGETIRETMRINRCALIYEHAFSDRVRGRAGGTFWDVSGQGIEDIPDDFGGTGDMDSIGTNAFDYSRLDWGGLLGISAMLRHRQVVTVNAHAGMADSDAGDAVTLDSIDDDFTGKLSGKYAKTFGNRGNVSVSLSWKLGENAFGGANVSMTFYL